MKLNDFNNRYFAIVAKYSKELIERLLMCDFNIHLVTTNPNPKI